MTKAELESKHIAELHALAAAAGVPRYRTMRREKLVEELLAGDGGSSEAESGVEGAGQEAGTGADAGGAEAESETDDRPSRRPRRRRRSRGSARPGPAEGDREEPEQGGEETEEASGVLDIVAQGHGFLRLEGIEPDADDVYISASQIRRCELRPGDQVTGPVRAARRGERHRALVRVDRVNGGEAGAERESSFEELTPVAPSRRIGIAPGAEDVLVRAADLLAPLAFGQRVLVRSQPRSGRTTLLRGLARAIVAAPEPPGLVVLLIDERPEEITEWKRALPDAEIAAAGADLEGPEQVRHAELAVARAKRRAERGEDVVLIVDSLTRLGVAYGDAAAVKPVFGAGRELEEEAAGSLTVIATVLARTEDGDGVLEATETTENATLTLDPELASAGIVPALDVAGCALSGEESLRSEEELAAVRRLRAELAGLGAADAAAVLRERIESSPSNAELLVSLQA